MISDNVSLSRTLDEMIMDGTEFDVIVQFLESHESDIKEIFKKSVMVFDLYDIIGNPERIPVNGFLEKHIQDLPSPVDRMYASAMYRLYYVWIDSEFTPVAVMKTAKSRFWKYWTELRVHRGYFVGNTDDYKFAGNPDEFIAWLDNVSSDNRDISNMVTRSNLFKSAFMYRTFNELNVTTKYALLNFVINSLKRSNLGWNIWYYNSVTKSDGYSEVLLDVLVSLLKQFLYYNDIEGFNFIVDKLFVSTNSVVRTLILHTLKCYIPKSISEGIDSLEFSEMVFDMNLHELDLDMVDLFLYAYLKDDDVLKHDMVENQDLVEFFNLSFDWNELSLFKNYGVKK